jgi:hypothetical protein
MLTTFNSNPNLKTNVVEIAGRKAVPKEAREGHCTANTILNIPIPLTTLSF